MLWCLPRPDLYGPGLAAYGLDPARLVLVRAPCDSEILWAMEEGLRAPGIAAVVGEVGSLPAVASRFWARDITAMICIAIGIGLASGYIGLLLSFNTAVPAGPGIILVAGAIYLASVIFGRFGGLARQLFPGRHLEA